MVRYYHYSYLAFLFFLERVHARVGAEVCVCIWGYIYMYVSLCSGGQRSASGVTHEEPSTLFFDTVYDQAGMSGQ